MKKTLPMLSKAVKLSLFALVVSSLNASTSWAQSPTPGLIFKPATAGTPGSAVLDPNGDGYISATGTGFTTAAGDVGAQSEIPYRYLPQRSLEPNTDLRVGPSNKFTDFADVSGGGSSVGFYVDGYGNYMFRMRLGGSAPNAQGYSIAIDTDNKFGFTGATADPNAVAHNPGFEMEIELVTNYGVRLYNIDGTTNPTGTGPDNSLVQLDYASYAQKAVAVTTNNGDLDVFYDFYIPIAVIQQYFPGFTTTTPLRMVASTLIAPHSITQYQYISDIGGVNDASYPNPDNAFMDLIAGSTATSGALVPSNSGNSISARSAAPVVSSPIQVGATSVSGTSTEAAGTIITVYINGTAQSATTATVQIGGSWALSGLPALASGALVKAVATATNKSASAFSNEVQVSNTGTACATPVPSAPTCVDNGGRGIAGNAPVGYLVYLRYLDGTLVPTTITNNPVTVGTGGTYLFTSRGGNNPSCSSGSLNDFSGSYLISQAATSGGCESAGYEICVGTAITATPTVSTAKPITSGTTSITGAATAGATVLLYLDGALFSSVTATGGSYTFSGSKLPTLTTGHSLTVYAFLSPVVVNNKTTPGTCRSTGVSLNVVNARTVSPPIVNSPLVTGATTVSGTSVEATGSTITLTTYAAADGSGTATATYTTTVDATGTWSVTTSALAAGSSVKATVTPSDYTVSGFSNVVPVQTRTASVPVIAGTYIEGATSVSGTSGAAVGSLITVYEDGGVLGTTTIASGGTWTLTGLSSGSGVSPNTAYPTLYAGGVLTSTATETGKLASTPSTAVTAGCAPITDNSFSTTAICQNQTASFTVTDATPGVVYSLVNTTSSPAAQTGVSRVGTGSGASSLQIPTAVFTTAGSYTVKLNAYVIGATNCSQTTANTVTLTVNPLAADKSVTAQNSTVGPNNSGTSLSVVNSQTDVDYQLINITTNPSSNVGSRQTGNGSTLALPTGPISATTTYAVLAVTINGCISQLSQTQTVTYSSTPLPVVLVAFDAAAKLRDAVLTWRTASEQNSDRFEVERSLDGVHFTYFGQVAAQNNSTTAHNYTLTDVGSARLGQQVYYRLRQVDLNGVGSYSPVRSVAFTAVPPQASISLYPNPASTSLTLNLSSLPADTYTVSVLSTTGQLLSSKQLAGGQEHDLAIAGLPAGLYIVRVQGAAFNQNQTFVKLP